MTLNIDKEYPGDVEFDYEAIARQVVEAALDSENCPYEAEVSLVLTTDEDIHRTNREFREIDRVTDVLSFPMLDYDTPGISPLRRSPGMRSILRQGADLRGYYDRSAKNAGTG